MREEPFVGEFGECREPARGSGKISLPESLTSLARGQGRGGDNQRGDECRTGAVKASMIASRRIVEAIGARLQVPPDKSRGADATLSG